MAELDLRAAVDSATEWAVERSGLPLALAHLCRQLAKELTSDRGDDAKPAPTAALAKELSATLEKLEALRDGDDAQGQLVAGLSTPVLYGAGSEPTDIRSARGKGRRTAR